MALLMDASLVSYRVASIVETEYCARITPLWSGSYGFCSALLAQSVERRAYVARVKGSIPLRSILLYKHPTPSPRTAAGTGISFLLSLRSAECSGRPRGRR